MNQVHCKDESKIVAASLAGTVDSAATAHLNTCINCREALRLSRLLNQHAATLQRENLPPAQGRVWRRAQMQRRQNALRRAGLSLAFMHVLGTAYVVALLAWSVRLYLHSHTANLSPDWTAIVSPAILFAGGAALFFILVGSAVLLLAGRRPAALTIST